MSDTFTRQELYDLVWAEPMSILAKRFKISDVGLAKACKRANIPRPPRGYWAKLKVGKKVFRQPLQARQPGMSNTVQVRADRYRYYGRSSDEDILDSNPQPPVFEDEIEDVIMRVRAMVRRVTVPRMPDRAHRLIRSLLDADEERRQKQANSRFSYSWDNPIFEDRFERRRLQILNAIMTALEKTGMKPSVSGREARDLDVRINDTSVHFTLDAPTQKRDRYDGRSAIATRGSSNKLRLEILDYRKPSGGYSWEDTDKAKLETHLTEIVVELIVSGERQYRESQIQHYEWLVERKAALIEEIRKRKEEAERKERERQAALEQARIDELLDQATALRRAMDIRAYVKEVRALCAAEVYSVSGDALIGWTEWALAQADRIDPVQSGRFLDSMRELTDLQEEG